MIKKPKKLGLALSGGGIMGVAHIGLLEQIEKHNIKIDLISGSSSGAIIGALFSDGGTQKIYEFLNRLDRDDFFSIKKLLYKYKLPHNIFNAMYGAIEKTLTAKSFKDLKIPLICTATDIVGAREKIFDSGALIPALRASAAYPGVFPTEKIKNKYYIDGGVLSNFPVKILKTKNCDFIMGSLTNQLPHLRFTENQAPKLSTFDTLMRAIKIGEQKIAEIDKQYCDIIFEPPIYYWDWYNFSDIDIIREIGQDYAQRNMYKLLRILNNE
ncbi:MAG: patatin-like phospholipase family protein [Bacteroidales bacterium]|nr:patatin-like phospholipase family protein [Bacteroidales bacterium]